MARFLNCRANVLAIDMFKNVQTSRCPFAIAADYGNLAHHSGDFQLAVLREVEGDARPPKLRIDVTRMGCRRYSDHSVKKRAAEAPGPRASLRHAAAMGGSRRSLGRTAGGRGGMGGRPRRRPQRAAQPHPASATAACRVGGLEVGGRRRAARVGAGHQRDQSAPVRARCRAADGARPARPHPGTATASSPPACAPSRTCSPASCGSNTSVGRTSRCG